MQILNNPNLIKIYEHNHGNRWNIAEYFEAPRYSFNETSHRFFLNKEDDTIILQVVSVAGEEASDLEEYYLLYEGLFNEYKETYQFDKTVDLERIVEIRSKQVKGKPFTSKDLDKLLEKHSHIIHEEIPAQKAYNDDDFNDLFF